MTNEELKQKIEDVFVDYINNTEINGCAKIAIDFAIEQLKELVIPKVWNTQNLNIAIKINELEKQKEELNK